MKPRIMKAAILAAVAATGAMLAFGAQAHAHLVKANPAPNAVTAAPAAIDLLFSEKLEPKFSGVTLMTSAGAGVPVASEIPANDRKAIHATPKAALTPGAYMVMWRVLSADGHKMTGQYNFTVK